MFKCDKRITLVTIMSNIEGRLKDLQERIRREGLHNQGGLGAPKSGGTRRPRPRKCLYFYVTQFIFNVNTFMLRMLNMILLCTKTNALLISSSNNHIREGYAICL